MLGLRQTLTLAFGGLLALLFGVALTGIFVLNRYSATLETIFRENYDTVLYAEHMKDAVDDLDAVAERSLWNPAEDVDARVREAVERFEANMRSERGNITLPGEGEAARKLQAQWESYRKDLEHSFASGDGDARRSFYRDVLLGEAEEAKATAQHIIDINLANMVSVDGRARAEATSAKRAMVALMAVGALLAISFTAFLARAILRPVKALTASAKQIESGNLDLEVPVTSGDELGQLGEAFNSMAARLREFRSSDRARLLRTQKTTQLAVDSFPDAVAVIGLDGRVELANQAAERFFHLRPGNRPADAADPALAGVLGRILDETFATRRAFQPEGYEAAIERVDGGRRAFQPKAVPILAEDGALVGITLVLSDVTNLRRLDEMKSGLVSTVSHELKTPLTSIRMATHLLLEGRLGPLTGRQSELLGAAREDSDRLYSIIDNLLDIDRIGSKGARMEIAATPVADLVGAGVRNHRPLFHDKGVVLDVDVPAGLPSVMADGGRLRHVFANLLDNALRHTPAGGRVVVSASRGDGGVEFAFRDTGSGIAPEHLPHVFERFYRASDTAGDGGAGLGLAIVKEVVEAHEATITVASRPGEGTTFRFALREAGAPAPADSGAA